MSFEDTLPKVEINFPPRPSKDFVFKINGRKINGTTGIVIKSAIASGEKYPIVEVSFYAKEVKGFVKGIVTQKP